MGAGPVPNALLAKFLSSASTTCGGRSANFRLPSTVYAVWQIVSIKDCQYKCSWTNYTREFKAFCFALPCGRPMERPAVGCLWQPSTSNAEMVCGQCSAPGTRASGMEYHRRACDKTEACACSASTPRSTRELCTRRERKSHSRLRHSAALGTLCGYQQHRQADADQNDRTHGLRQGFENLNRF